MKISKKEAIRKHRMMWNWIADQYQYGSTKSVLELKQEFTRVNDPGVKIPSNCYCCMYAGERGDFFTPISVNQSLYNCERCPLEWPASEGTKELMCYELTHTNEYGLGLYSYVAMHTPILPGCGDPHKVATVARKIANLPERKIEEE